MNVTHSGITYACAVAVKCENDKYIKLYDINGAEIVAFYDISDFSEYTISGGSFVAPCDCAMPIPLTAYSIGGLTITPEEWTLGNNNIFMYRITNELISANESTCNISILFNRNTSLINFRATQKDGYMYLYTDAAPLVDVVIESIQITRV